MADNKGPDKGRQQTTGTVGADVSQPTPSGDLTVKRRVVCDLPNASKQIDGLTFARVKLGGATVHISENVTDEKAYKRLLTVPGFSAWTGNEDEHARAIEDALDASRKAPTASTASAVADYQRRLNEAAASSRSMAQQYKKLSDENATLKQKNADLQLQVDALRGARAQVDAPVAAKVATV